MTKRHIMRQLEKYRMNLTTLSPEERLKVFLKAANESNEGWMESLQESTPRDDHSAYTKRGWIALQFRLHALYELHTCLLEYQLEKTMQQAVRMHELSVEEKISEASFGQPGEYTEQINILFVELYTQYHAYDRFAEDAFGVNIETWFGSHPNGSSIIEAITKVLADSTQRELATKELNNSENEPGDEDWTTLEEVTETCYEKYVGLWKDVVEDIGDDTTSSPWQM